MSGASPERRSRLERSLPETPPEQPLIAVPDSGDEAEPGIVTGGRPRSRSCPLGICDGSGWIVDDEASEARPCECRDKIIEKARARGVSASLPKRYRGVSIDRPPISDMARDPNNRSQVADVLAFARDIDARLDAGQGLWLEGDAGTGKTSLAMLVSRMAMEAGRTAAIYSLPQLLTRIRRTFDDAPGEDSYSTFFNRLIGVDLLHLDDLGTEFRSEWVMEQLYSIVDARYNDQRSIVVTTNLPEPELRKQLGDRIVSRLTQICGDPLLIRGKDRRIELAPPPADPSA